MKSPFLAPLNPTERYRFLSYCHRRRFNAGDFVYYEEDPGNGMYFIEEGKVELISKETVREDESEHPQITLASPQTFGVLALGSDEKRFATARCITECTLLGFLRPDFDTLRDRRPRIAIKIMQMVSMTAAYQLNLLMNEVKKTGEIDPLLALQMEVFPEQLENTLL